MYYGWYFDPTMLLILPALLLAMWAQFRVQSTFRKYSDVPSAQGWTAAEMAADLLARFAQTTGTQEETDSVLLS